jgi:hypothetical protein
MAMIAAHASMRSDALALGEHLHRPCGDPHLDFCAGEVMWTL